MQLSIACPLAGMIARACVRVRGCATNTDIKMLLHMLQVFTACLLVQDRLLGATIVWCAQPSPNIHNSWSWNVIICSKKTSRIHILCVLPDWNHWNLPLCHGLSSMHYFSWCTRLVEHSRPRCCILPGGWAIYLLQLFYADSRSILLLDSWGRTRVLSPSEFSWMGCAARLGATSGRSHCWILGRFISLASQPRWNRNRSYHIGLFYF
jgi:hypothetical protein